MIVGNMPTAIMANTSRAMGTNCMPETSVMSAKRSLMGPNITRWIVQSMYPAARTTPNAAIAVGIAIGLNAPRKMSISATKPLVPGKPSEASPATRRATARKGMRFASPPRSGM